jgi:Na+/H+-dicarboxylate symporter
MSTGSQIFIVAYVVTFTVVLCLLVLSIIARFGRLQLSRHVVRGLAYFVALTVISAYVLFVMYKLAAPTP